MKKLFFVSLIGILSITGLLAQPACVKDAWYTLQNGQIPKARIQIEKCYAETPTNADILLMRGNIYLRLYGMEMTELGKNSSYKIKFPDAIYIANESFSEAIKNNPNVKPMSGCRDATRGQSECADILVDWGIKNYKEKKYEEAVKYFSAAIRSYRVAKNRVALADTYYSLAIVNSLQDNYPEYIENLKNAANEKSDNSMVYELLYAETLKIGDTIAAFKFLTDGEKTIKADSNKYQLLLLEVNHYAMMGDTAKILESANTLIDKYGKTPENIANISLSYSNANMFTHALAILNEANEEHPNNPQIVKGLAYSYFFYAVQYQEKITAAVTAGKYDQMPAIQAEQKKVQQEAYKWAKEAVALATTPEDIATQQQMVNQLEAVLGIKKAE